MNPDIGARGRRPMFLGAAALALLWLAAALPIIGPHSILAAGDESSPPDTTPPAPVAGLAAVDARDGNVSLSWNASSDSDFACYALYYSDEPFLTIGNRTAVARLDNITSTGFTVADLTNGVQYFFAVTAVDLAGNENRTVVSVSATPTASVVEDTTAPPAVLGLAAVDARDGRVDLTWAPVNVPDFGHYSVYIAPEAGLSLANLVPAMNITGMATGGATVSGLKDNSTYYFAVTAVDLAGNENRTVLASVSATPTPTPTPPPANPPKGPAERESEATETSLFFALPIVVAVALAVFLALEKADGPRPKGAARNEWQEADEPDDPPGEDDLPGEEDPSGEED